MVSENHGVTRPSNSDLQTPAAGKPQTAGNIFLPGSIREVVERHPSQRTETMKKATPWNSIRTERI